MTTVEKHEIKRSIKVKSSQSFDPTTDTYLVSNYDKASIAKRIANKTAWQKAANLKTDKERLLMTVCLPFQQEEAVKLLKELLPALKSLPVQLVVLQEEEGFSLSEEKDNLRIAKASLENLHLSLAGSDLYLFLAKAKRPGYALGLSLKYGAVPVVPESETRNALLGDYDPVREKGAGFVYADASVWSLFAAIVRAVETYKLPYDWKGVQRNGMELEWPEELKK